MEKKLLYNYVRNNAHAQNSDFYLSILKFEAIYTFFCYKKPGSGLVVKFLNFWLQFSSKSFLKVSYFTDKNCSERESKV